MVEARSVSSLETYQYRWNIAPLAMLCMCGRAQSGPILRTCTRCFISAQGSGPVVTPFRWVRRLYQCDGSAIPAIRRPCVRQRTETIED
jgi:hypothetical protein